ncbi:nucleotide-binding protein [Lacrimispora aerotolerans]|jgi:pilus assembly protein CpaE|uniref:nucleotide-binding protein n=1 Tax=Lacrimispora aerotolerans TaxID=36832 RepID=UPI00047E576F|nr:P-loop NTPase [Lacrimispora aerotolerans]
MKVKVLLLGEPERCAQIKMQLRDEEITIMGIVVDENQVLNEINRTQPDLILITDTSSMALRSCQQIYLLRPRSVPVVLSDLEDSKKTYKILQSGVHNILSQEIEPLSLIAELKGIYSNESNRILALENTGTLTAKSKVILLFGPKDGVGKTTLAVNLAVKLAQKNNKVVVLDCDFQSGDVNAFLGMNPKSTVLELIQEQSNPNVDTIRQFLSLHLSGVNFLPNPHSPEYASSITARQVESIIAALRVYYDYVIVDTVSGFDDISASCIECASSILFVTGKDVPALHNAKKSLAVLGELSDKEKIRLIMGKSEGNRITQGDVSRVLGIPVWGVLPYDEKSAVTAANQGQPVVLGHPKSRISREISSMADRLEEMTTGVQIGKSRKKRGMILGRGRRKR